MQYTTNYNLKKPEGSDPVNIQDFNDNADNIDVEMKKRITATGGDISNTKIATVENITTEFPVPAEGDAPKTFLGKMKKFTEDFKNLKTGLMTVGMLVNNCVTNNPNLPLSAAQGKELMDMLTKLNGDLELKTAGVTFRTMLEGRISKITLFAFYRLPDNPFSFNSGYCIAFNSSLLHTANQFVLIGVPFAGNVIEAQPFNLI